MDRLKICSLSYSDCVILTEAIVFAVPVELSLRWISIKKLLKFIGRTRRSGGRPEVVIDGDRASRLVEAISKFYPFNATCLKKSLVLLWILRKRGLPAELRLGVRKVGGQLEGHAWVVCRGGVLLDGNIAHLFVPMPLKI